MTKSAAKLKEIRRIVKEHNARGTRSWSEKSATGRRVKLEVLLSRDTDRDRLDQVLHAIGVRFEQVERYGITSDKWFYATAFVSND